MNVHRFKLYLFLLLPCFILSLPSSLFADGCFIVRDPFMEELGSPAQKAVIVYDGIKEELILYVDYRSYKKEIEDFAWVIPVPGYPEVKKSEERIFTELARYTETKVSESLMRGGAFYGFNAIREQAVTVWERKRVGAYDISILSSDDPEALFNWLIKNGYKVSEKMQEVFQHYIEKKWYFIAAKVSPGGAKEGTLHPLRLIFESKEMIYPMKMTSINSGRTDVILYIFHKDKVKIPGFSLRYAGKFIRINKTTSSLMRYYLALKRHGLGPPYTYLASPQRHKILTIEDHEVLEFIEKYPGALLDQSRTDFITDPFLIALFLEEKYFLTKLQKMVSLDEVEDDYIIFPAEDNEPYN
ncbi:DUF2330 domain-containing protein [Candidatus Omnitrophota bacterium]